MATQMLDTAALSQLQSKDQCQLLDVVDELRSQGVSSYIDLPQLIVCGDQSSGKSSVLEAISRVKFPTKNKLCTRFATELVLRKTPSSHVSVSIRPAPSRSEEEKERLSTFHPPFNSTEDLPQIIESAKECMGCSETGDAFCEDVLCIESSGPDRPHLTIVDLPGLFHSESKQQSKQDGELVSKLVQSYMENPKSIILAIVAANYDFANQVVLERARRVDPEGLRTLGIITKPDLLDPDSEGEQTWVSLARNEDIVFRLGWHVLKNRSFQSREFSPTERDNSEREYFSQGVWRQFDQKLLGIKSLRERLNKINLQHICSDLPRITKEIKSGVQECKSSLDRLGKARPTFEDQRKYLSEISQEYYTITTAAVNGFYSGKFFEGDLGEEDQVRRFRAVIHKANDEFSTDMHNFGHGRRILNFNEEKTRYRNGFGSNQQIISREQFAEEIKVLNEKYRGRELPGMMNPLLVGQLFRNQAQPWKGLALDHIESVFQHANDFVENLLGEVTCEETKSRIINHYLAPLLNEHLKKMEAKLEEIILPHTRDAPMTYDPHFRDSLDERKSSFETESPDEVPKDDMREALDIVDYMTTYYEHARRIFIDNVTALVIENCLVFPLPHLLTSNSVLSMSEAETGLLAGEPQDVQLERKQLEAKLGTLDRGLRIINRYSGRTFATSYRSKTDGTGSNGAKNIPTITRTSPTVSREGASATYRPVTPNNQTLPAAAAYASGSSSAGSSPSAYSAGSPASQTSTAATSPSGHLEKGEHASPAPVPNPSFQSNNVRTTQISPRRPATHQPIRPDPCLVRKGGSSGVNRRSQIRQPPKLSSQLRKSLAEIMEALKTSKKSCSRTVVLKGRTKDMTVWVPYRAQPQRSGVCV